MAKIVVGTDGSENSVRALRWAIDEAVIRDAEVELVHAYSDPPLTAYPTLVLPPISADDLREAAERVVDATVADVGDTRGVSIRRITQVGGATGVLIDRAGDADLLVVGARGLGGFRGLLVGSVTHQILSHSPCPVVTIVPERR